MKNLMEIRKFVEEKQNNPSTDNKYKEMVVISLYENIKKFWDIDGNAQMLENAFSKGQVQKRIQIKDLVLYISEENGEKIGYYIGNFTYIDLATRVLARKLAL